MMSGAGERVFEAGCAGEEYLGSVWGRDCLKISNVDKEALTI